MLELDTNAAPPNGNTGARTTSARWGVDWLEYTCPDGTLITDAVPWIPFEQWEDLQHGWKFYAHSWKAGSTLIAFGGAEGQGVHVTLSSTALRETVGMWGLESPLSVFKYLGEKGYRASRIDWAGDVFTDPTFIDFVQQKLEAKQATMRWKAWEPRQKHRLGKGVLPGRTIEFGTRNSDTFARLYDKKAERAAKNMSAADELGFEPESWTRFEIVARRKVARRLQELIFWEDWTTIQEMVLGLLNLREDRGDDSNKSRWETSSRWAGFVSATVARTLGLPTVYKSVERFIRWIEGAVVPGLAAVLDGNGQAGQWLADALTVARRRWRHRHYQLMADASARQWGGIPAFALG